MVTQSSGPLGKNSELFLDKSLDCALERALSSRMLALSSDCASTRGIAGMSPTPINNKNRTAFIQRMQRRVLVFRGH